MQSFHFYKHTLHQKNCDQILKKNLSKNPQVNKFIIIIHFNCLESGIYYLKEIHNFISFQFGNLYLKNNIA